MSMSPAVSAELLILVINGGLSSGRFACWSMGLNPHRIFGRSHDGIGRSGAVMRVIGDDPQVARSALVAPAYWHQRR